MKSVNIGKKSLGPGNPCYVIAEIGINHNGDIDLAKRLISVAVAAGCDAVKFQKRTVEVVYSEKELATPRPNPFGDTNGDLKRGLEFGEADYEEIAAFCRQVKIDWFVSPWDEASVDFVEQFDPPVYKVASASLTDDHLLNHVRRTGKPILASTGMSTYAEIDHAVEVLGKENLVLMHTTSTYPAKYEQLNLRAIPSMIDRYGIPVGYSGHETGIPTSVAAAVLGACCVERHITMDRAMWGSDQAASLEPNGITRLVRDIRLCEQSMGDGVKRVYEEEIPVMKKLRPDRRSCLMPLTSKQLTDGLRNLQAIAFDVDGVLTDGTLTWSPLGKEYKTFSFSDIMGVSLLRRLGIKMALVSGEASAHVDRYAEKMHIPHVIKGTRDKAGALRNFAGKFDLSLARTCFFGDDVNDLFAMDLAGLCACPSNAASEVLTHVAERGFVATRQGGDGAVREFTDAVLAARNLTGREVFQLRPPE